jgi:hypothetical protein
MFKIIPIEVNETTMLEPPALMKGRALPVNGSKPTITDIFIKASIAIQAVKPKAIREPNWSGAFFAMTSPRHMSKTNSMTTNKPPKMPISSAMTAKILSVGARGRPVNFVSA